MEQSQEKRKKEYREYRIAQILSFALPFLIMMTIFALRKIYPFGDRSFLCTDLYHQYMPFFCEFVRTVKAGDGLSFSWNVGIGSNFLALYVYYLASPLHWLVFLVPEEHIIEFISYLVVVKIGLCGLTSFVYLSSRRTPAGERRRGRDGSALAFACMYALSGYMAAYNWNIMWLDCVILLPLIVMGLERLVEEGRCGLYCATLALSILTNYYISIMICIFLVLYFGYLYAVLPHKAVGVWKGRVARHFRPVAQFAFYSLLAGGMASALLIPEVCAILRTDFGNLNFPKTIQSYFSVLDMLARHCMSVSVEKGLDHWPNLYCGVGVFLLLPLYALDERQPARKRFGMLALAGFLLMSFSTNVLNYIWHGCNYPDSLPARQSFLYIFLILTMCYDAFRDLDFAAEGKKERIIRVYLGATAALLLVEKFVDQEDFSQGAEWLTFLFMTLYAVALYLAYRRPFGVWRATLGGVVLAVVVLEAGINTFQTSVSTVSRSEYLANQEDYKALYALVTEREEGFLRVEKFARKTKNDACLGGYPTASVFSSTMNSSVMDLYTRLGMRHSKVYYGYDGATAFSSALLNVKYMFGEGTEYANRLYTVEGQSGEICAYRAEYTLPFGYLAPTGFDLPTGFKNNGLRLQNQMVHDLGIEEMLFEKCESGSQGDDVKFTAQQEGIYYGLITTSGTKKVRVEGGSPRERKMNDLKVGSVLYLGYLDEGDRIRIINDDAGDDTRKVAADIYRMDEEVLKAALDVLDGQYLQDVEYDSTHIRGRILLEKEGRLILSVPREEGWSVRLNGEKIRPELFGGTLMAFDLQPGEYVLEMHYVPEGVYVGIAVSILSLLCFPAVLEGGRKNGGEARKELAKEPGKGSDKELVKRAERELGKGSDKESDKKSGKESDKELDKESGNLN